MMQQDLKTDKKISLGIIDNSDSNRRISNFLLENSEQFKIYLSEKEFKPALHKFSVYKNLQMPIDVMLVNLTDNEEMNLEFINGLRSINQYQTILLQISQTQKELLNNLITQKLPNGIIYRESRFDEVYAALQELASGNDYYTPEIFRLIRKHQNKQIALNLKNNTKMEKLTKREIEILELVSEGFTSREIAIKLTLSKKTVDVHREHILKKFESNNMIKVLYEVNRIGA
ncbi:MAG: response regulator transcription factor [Bacteroidetes bacterium]|nr:response regulator transcription factor [Bacteroidota bacterium]